MSAAAIRTIGILYAEESGRGLMHPFFAPILNAIKEEAEANGFCILFINCKLVTTGTDCAELCRGAGLEGVCLVCFDFSSPEIRELAASGIPCVTIDHILKGVPTVISDNETGVQRLIEYAISKGHRRIAFVHGHNNSVVTRTRIRQFQNTMDYYKLPVPGDFLREGEYDNIELTRSIVGCRRGRPASWCRMTLLILAQGTLPGSGGCVFRRIFPLRAMTGSASVRCLIRSSLPSVRTVNGSV